MTLRTPTLVLILLLSALLGCNNTPSRPITLVTSPEVVTLEAGSESVEVSAMIQNGDGPISWQLSPQVGSLSQSNGPVVRYTPPATLATETIVTLTASIPNGPSATITLTLRPGLTEAPQLTVRSSLGATTYGGRTVRLEATPQAKASDARWSLSPPLGSLSNTTGATVEYTPPPFVGEPTEVTVSTTLENHTVIHKISLQVPTPACSWYWNGSNTTTIGGYTPEISYAPGDLIELKVNSPRGDFGVAIYEESSTPRLRYFQRQVRGQIPPPPTNPFVDDLNWPTSLHFRVPDDWRSGLYNALLSDSSGQCFELVFVVKPPSSRPKAHIALLASDFTWQAYNAWGGASMYACPGGSELCYVPYHSVNIAHVVSTQRPNQRTYVRAYPGYDQQFSAGVHRIATWLERNGFSFDMITDTDLDADPDLLSGYKVLFFERHSEYWSKNMYDHLERFLAEGGSLFNPGANQIFWKTVYQDHKLEVRKNRSQHTFVNEPGGKWRDLNRSEARVLGVRFTEAGAVYSNRSNFTVVNSLDWVFQGTQLQAGMSFGDGCSGWETDKIDPLNQPPGLVTLARGNNIDPNRPSAQAGADMVSYPHPGGGRVFSTGSIAFFSETCLRDPHVNRIMNNVLRQMLGQ